MLRGIAAVIGGIAVYSLLLFGATWAGHVVLGRNESELINQSVTTQLLWFVWNGISMAAAGYVAAVIAKGAPVTSAVVMGSIQALFTLVALFTAQRDITPLWLWIGVIVVTLPGAWLGARLGSLRYRSPGRST